MHFNTPMAKRGLGFPRDLQVAKELKECGLSFSTIQVGDCGPSQVPFAKIADANAGGSVGVVVDVEDHGCVLTVGAFDDGTDYWDDGSYLSGGKPPSATECAKSIDDRKVGANEWLVKDYAPLGIFVFLPPYVYQRGNGQGERPSSLAEILAAFSGDRIFSTNGYTLMECNRTDATWVPVDYDAIVPLASKGK